MMDGISPKQFHESKGVEDWRVLGGDGATAHFRTGSLAAGALLVQAISELPGVDRLHPDVDVRHEGVTVRMMTFTGLRLTVIPGATVTAEVMPFWRAALGYEPRIDSPDEDLVDPHSRGPAFWFERMKAAPGRRRRDPHGDLGAVRAGAGSHRGGLAAGGRMVRDDFAPSWWTLADAAGNEADIATTTGRD